MNHITPDEVFDLAPAAAPFPKAPAPVIDTAAFLRHVRTFGFRPVMALQPTTHEDAQYAKRRDGRHLVVVANPDNLLCLVLVNSHTVDLKPKIGLGDWSAADGFLIGSALTMKRRNGFKEAVAALMAQREAFLRVRAGLADWNAQERTLLSLATDIINEVYARRSNKPATTSLIPETYDGMLDACHQMFNTMRRGGLPPRRRSQRRVKGIISPDGLFEAAEIVMATAMARSRTPAILAPARGASPV